MTSVGLSRRSRFASPAFTDTPWATRVLLAYVLLWVIEGAVRKWVPGTQSVFYLLRDVGLILAFLTFAVAPLRRRFSAWWPVLGIWVLCLVVLSGGYAIVREVPIIALVAGIRGYIAPILIIAFIASFVSTSALRPTKRLITVLALVNLTLVIIQVLSPASAFVNLQVGGEEAHFVNAGAAVRASGTFSAPAGLAVFGAISTATAASMAFGGDASEKRLGRVGFVASIATAGLSGSRGFVLAVVIVLVVLLITSMLRGGDAARSAFVWVIATIAAGVLAARLWFPVVIDAFFVRIDRAAQSEDSAARLFETTFAAFSAPVDIFGAGPGARGNVALASGASAGQWVESEAGRWVAELGLLGLALAAVKLLAALVLAAFLLRHFKSAPLGSLLLGAYLVPTLLWGSITQQPSTQGAFGLAVGLFILEMRRRWGLPTEADALAAPPTRPLLRARRAAHFRRNQLNR